MENKEQRPKVGMGVLIFKEGKVLVGKRAGEYAGGEYAFPGGHIEYMESFEECVRREVREEVGIEVKNIKFLNVANVTTYAPKHYINVEFTADWESGEPQTLEPDKITDWQWCSIDAIPKPLFDFSQQGVESYKTGRNFFDAKS